jgi:hypothetical protein
LEDAGSSANHASGSPGPVNGKPREAIALPSGKLTPELLDWARQQFSEEEIIAGLREVQQTGGLELSDFIRELEEDAVPRE